MKSEERLLADVLRAGDYESFQGLVQDAMVAAARAKKARKRQLLAMAASLAVMGTALFWMQHREGVSNDTSAEVRIVRTEPLPAGMVVRTESRLQVVRSVPGVSQIETLRESVATITDQQLLNLFRDRPVALVRMGSEVRLVTPGNDSESQRQ
jgi:hypothetical protein